MKSGNYTAMAVSRCEVILIRDTGFMSELKKIFPADELSRPAKFAEETPWKNKVEKQSERRKRA